MLCWLPVADPATRSDGARLAARVLEVYGKLLATSARKKGTIALAEVAGLEVAVVFHVNLKTAERLAGRLRKIGIAASATCGNDHAEVVLHRQEPGINVIAISNPKGPCGACETYFANTPDGFANVYWDSAGWVQP